MDLKFCGIIDIVMVLLLLILCFIGYKKGFLNKAIGLVSFLVALIVAFIFCTQLAALLKDAGIIYPSVFESIYGNVSSSTALSNPEATVSEVLTAIKVPGFIANMIGNAVGHNIVVTDIAATISEYIAGAIMNVICFAILFFGVFIVAFVLKIVAKILRGNIIIRIVDGVLGIALYGSLFIGFVYVLFAILHFCMDATWFTSVKAFLDVDMKLTDPGAFRLSKYIYENNIVYEIINVLF